ncbi:hypothetical protein OJF2_22310 [Aquisphaera giovannonii]|uniref:Lipoprotein n=1 Tax=Aquisphaera giovannonii TaxID=406548 RepID=A0A5B9W155_9BACT|nr:hypothetical protein [Aquisphaera giovannonii]QEH33725.1 hypothetical protein OJF2_22310 [Aquisphaera giovannonii]
MRMRLAALVFLLACPSATACINDEESPSHEREFRSSYLKDLGRLAGDAEGSRGGFIDEAWYYAGGAAVVIATLAFSARRERAAGGQKPCQVGELA